MLDDTTLEKTIILFDGVCNLCNGAVQFIITRDKHSTFHFASLQSAIGQQLLEHHGLNAQQIDTIVLIEQNQAYTHSTAALKIAKHLTMPWPALALALYLPSFIRDGVYKWIAKNRYEWLGKREACMLPRAEWKAKFLS